MADIETCPKCGGELPENAPSGLCPKCLMRAALGAESGSDMAATTPQPGGFIPPEPAALAGHFPQLEILELIGHGGMGAVYKARQTKLDRLVALKIIRPESANDAAFAERFTREARTLARLSHPHIVAVHDFGEIDSRHHALRDVEQTESDKRGTHYTEGDDKSRDDFGTLYYFVMEFVDGLNLRELLDGGGLKPEQALAIVPQICDALQFAHDEGVVHRDIKPENVLIDTKGRVKIADFGLAKLAIRSDEDFTLTATHQVMGTPRYMAPEQMAGSHRVDHRADIYSLGVVFYEMLTGEVPMGQFEPPSKKSSIDARLDAVVLRALAREPERRFQQASEIKSSVESLSTPPVQGGTFARDEPPPGVSAILDREVSAVWRWVAGVPQTAAQRRPRFPALFMILLCVTGALTVLLPWIDVEIFEGVYPDPRLDGSGDFSRDMPMPTLFTPGATHTFNGSDEGPGLVASVAFAALTLLLIAVPERHRLRLAPNLVIALLAGVALVSTFVFRVEPRGFEVPVNMSASSQKSGLTARPGSSPAVERSDMGHVPFRLSQVDHRLRYRSGFYGSLGLAVAVLVFSAIGIRHAIGGWDEPEPQSYWPIPSAPQLARPNAHAADIVESRTPMDPKNVAGNIPQPGAATERPSSIEDSGTEPGVGASRLPQFSKKALLGALLIPAAAISISLAMFAIAGPPASFALAAVVGLPGLAIPFVTTYLGISAVSDIRHAPGKVCGFGWAFFDAVFFPALLPVAAVAGLGQALYLLPICLLLELLLLSWLWNRVKPNEDAETEQSDEPPSRPRSTLGRAWDAWWADRDRWFTNAVQAVLVIVFFFCLITFFTFRTSTEAGPKKDGKPLRHVTVTYGEPTPWFQLETNPQDGTYFRWHINYFTWSSVVLLAGFVAWCIHWQIEKAKANAAGKSLGWVGSPNSIIVLWGVIMMLAVAWGMHPLYLD